MVTHQIWETFPPTYRADEIQTLARWIQAGESCSVVGLPGCGRSNLLDFLCHRPEVLRSYLPAEAGPVVLIPVDLNDLPADDPSTVYRVILRSFYWVRDRFDPSMIEAVTTLYLENRATQDPFLSQSVLYELLFNFQAEQTQVVLVLNRFDRFCQTASPQTLNSLRGLRDSFKETLCFIVGMRQEVAYLPDPDVLGDMYELLDSHVCWVGAMNEADARWVIATHTAPRSPEEAEIQAMLSLAGGFPVLLRAIGHWWLDAGGRLEPDEWPAALAKERSFDYRLARLWGGLTQEEQFACAAVREWQGRVTEADEKASVLEEASKTLAKEHGRILPRLTGKGLCRQADAGWEIRGELMADYINRVGPSSRGRIWIDDKTGDIYQGLTPLRGLAPQEDALLRFLIKHPYKRHPYSSLIEEVFDEPFDRTRHDLFPLVRNLRQKIEAKPSDPRYIINYTARPEGGYQFYPEGRPE